jgi:hypothetical protein
MDDKIDGDVKGSFGITPAEVDGKIAEMFKAGHPLQDKFHPNHESAKKEYMKLMEMKVKYK